MTIGERIKSRRLDLGMTVDELAEKINRNRATVYRYESDEIENMPITALEPLAAALRTSPWFLMGWIDDVEPSISSSRTIQENQHQLTQPEQNLLENYRNLNDIGKHKLIEFSNDLLSSGNYSGVLVKERNYGIAAYGADASEEVLSPEEEITT